MLGTKLTFAFAVTLLVLFITEENEVNAAPEPCKHMMSYMFKKPEKLTKPKEDKEKMEKDKKKDLLKNWEKMIGKMLRRALHLEDEEESTVKPRVGAMEDILANYINFLTYLWNIN